MSLAMKSIGTKIEAPEFLKNKVKIEDLIFYDGPLFTHFQCINEVGHIINVLFYWVDSDEDYNRWLVLCPVEDVLKDFLNGLSSFFILINFSTLFLIDMDNHLNYKNIFAISEDLIPKEYLPDEDWFMRRNRELRQYNEDY